MTPLPKKVYGGIPTACHLPNNPDDSVGKVIKDVEEKWYDGKYLNHTMNGLDCYPVYMQVRLDRVSLGFTVMFYFRKCVLN